MNSISLAIKSLFDNMKDRSKVQEKLNLGATPKQASEDIIKDSFDTSIMPTINSMIGIGIIFLPGMMTGQILAGESPITAVAYQIGIMFGIFGSVSLTFILLIKLGYKTFFNSKEQLE